MIAIENEPTVGDLSEGVELLMDDVGYAEHYRVDYFVLDGFGFYLEEEKAVVFYQISSGREKQGGGSLGEFQAFVTEFEEKDKSE